MHFNPLSRTRDLVIFFSFYPLSALQNDIIIKNSNTVYVLEHKCVFC